MKYRILRPFSRMDFNIWPGAWPAPGRPAGLPVDQYDFAQRAKHGPWLGTIYVAVAGGEEKPLEWTVLLGGYDFDFDKDDKLWGVSLVPPCERQEELGFNELYFDTEDGVVAKQVIWILQAYNQSGNAPTIGLLLALGFQKR